MPRCKPCAGADVKKAILEEIPGLKELLGKIADCEDPEGLELCGRTSRARSAYQEFVSSCMKAKKIKGFGESTAAMRSCAAEWRERKGKG